MEYSKLFSDAWNTFKKFKVLWVFGIASAFLRWGVSNIFTLFPGVTITDMSSIDSDQAVRVEEVFSHLLTENFGINLIWIVSAILLSMLISLIITSFIEGALIGMVDASDKDVVPTINDGIQYGKSNLKRLFWIDLIFQVVPLVLLIIVVLSILVPSMMSVVQAANALDPSMSLEEFSSQTETASGAGGGIAGVIFSLCCCGMIGIIIVRLWNVMAVNCCVIEGLGIRASFSRGWYLLRKNFWAVIFTIIILFLISIVLGLIILVPAVFGLSISGFSGVGQGGSSAPRLLNTIYSFFITVGIGGLSISFTSTLWAKLTKQMINFDSFVQKHKPNFDNRDELTE